jgi:hypothetical protein
MVTQLIVLIFCLLLGHGNCSNYTGNLDEAVIHNVITAAENNSSDLQRIAVFVGDALDKLWNYSWNIHVYGSEIQDSFSYSNYVYLKHYLNWEHYGKFNYTYMIWKDNKCKIKLQDTHSNLHEQI